MPIVMKPWLKTEWNGFERLLGWWVHWDSELLKRAWKPHPIPGALHTWSDSSLSIWLFLSCILYNEIVVISTLLPWVLWVVLVSYQTWVANWGKPQICNPLGRCMDYTKGPIYVDSPSLTRVVLWSWVLQLQDLGKLRIVSVKIKLNY